MMMPVIPAMLLVAASLAAGAAGDSAPAGGSSSSEKVTAGSEAARTEVAWRSVSAGIPGPVSVTALGVDRSGLYVGSVIGYALPGFFHRSSDRGQSWTLLDVLANPIHDGIVVDPRTPGTLFLVPDIFPGAIERTVDAGRTWTIEYPPVPQLNPGVPFISAIAIDPSNPDTIFAGVRSCYYSGCSGVLRKSQDSGQTWEVPPAEFFVLSDSLAVAPGGDSLYLGGLDGLFHSQDGGKTWEIVASLATSVSLVSIASGESPSVYAVGDHLYRSTDDGRSWDPLPDPQALAGIRSLVFDPHLPRLMFAGTTVGVFRSDDAGDNWTALNTGLTDLNVTALALDADTLILYAGGTSGVFALPIDEAPQSCASSATQLCLGGGRFRAEISWTSSDGTPNSGSAFRLTPDAGAFWFFSPGNLELAIKVVDGRAVDGHFWVFGGQLTNVEYTLTITDTTTGAIWTHHNPPGLLASFADTAAF